MPAGMVLSRRPAVHAVLALTLAGAAAAAQSLSSVHGFVSDDTGAALAGGDGRTCGPRARPPPDRDFERPGASSRCGPSSAASTTSSPRCRGSGPCGGTTSTSTSARAWNSICGSASLRSRETVTVNAEAPVLEVGRSGAAGYVDEEEIAALPIAGRDFVQFALLQPTVQVDPSRGTLSPQRAAGRELRPHDRRRQREERVLRVRPRGASRGKAGACWWRRSPSRSSRWSPAAMRRRRAAPGGGVMNVVTRSGGQRVRGGRRSGSSGTTGWSPGSRSRHSTRSAASRRTTTATGRTPSAAPTGGASLGGPDPARDRTHFFLSYDHTSQNQPFLRNIRGPRPLRRRARRLPRTRRRLPPERRRDRRPRPRAGPHRQRPVPARDRQPHPLRQTEPPGERPALAHRPLQLHGLRPGLRLRRGGIPAVRREPLAGGIPRLRSSAAPAVNEFRFQYAYDHFDRSSHLPDSARSRRTSGSFSPLRRLVRQALVAARLQPRAEVRGAGTVLPAAREPRGSAPASPSATTP